MIENRDDKVYIFCLLLNDSLCGFSIFKCRATGMPKKETIAKIYLFSINNNNDFDSQLFKRGPYCFYSLA